jgi:hypothetical protein
MLLETYCLLDHRSAANYVAVRRAGTIIISGRPGSAATFRPGQVFSMRNLAVRCRRISIRYNQVWHEISEMMICSRGACWARSASIGRAGCHQGTWLLAGYVERWEER